MGLSKFSTRPSCIVSEIAPWKWHRHQNQENDARWVRGSAVTTESLKWRIYVDNWHLTFSNIFPCTLILLYAGTGEKAKRHTRHIWQPICTLWILTIKSSIRPLRKQNCFFRFFSVRIECHTEKRQKIAENGLSKNCNSGVCKIALSVGKGCRQYLYFFTVK